MRIQCFRLREVSKLGDEYYVRYEMPEGGVELPEGTTEERKEWMRLAGVGLSVRAVNDGPVSVPKPLYEMVDDPDPVGRVDDGVSV